MAHFVAETVYMKLQQHGGRQMLRGIPRGMCELQFLLFIPPASMLTFLLEVATDKSISAAYQKDYKGPTIGCKVGQLWLTLFDLHSALSDSTPPRYLKSDFFLSGYIYT